MSNRQLYIIGGSIALLMLILIARVFEIKNIPDYNWNETYNYESKQPFGTWLMKSLIEEKYGKENIRLAEKPIRLDTTYSNSVLIAIGPNNHITTHEIKNLKKFIEVGNTVFFINGYTPINSILEQEEDTLSTEEYDYEADNLDDEEYSDEKEYLEEDDDYSYDTEDDLDSIDTARRDSIYNSYLNDTLFCFGFNELDTSYSASCYKHYEYDFEKPNTLDHTGIYQEPSYEYEALATSEDSLIFFYRVKHGEGNILIHNIPVLFTNVASRQNHYLDHFNNVFSYIHGDSIILSRLNQFDSDGSNQATNSPLQFILQTPSLTWAYYLLVATMIIYALFRSKRRQRVIPTLPDNKNTSLEYVDTLSTIFQAQNQNGKLVRHIKEGFHHKVKNKYFLDAKDKNYVEKLSKKTKVDTNIIQRLINKLEQSEQADLSDFQLINLYNQLESFYQKSK